MTAPKLKPCPFCGGEAVALTGPVKTLWGVTCLRCACWMDDRADTADEAVAAWNRRADLAAVQPALDKLIAEAVGPYVDALRALIYHTHECERELTEALYHADFCGESRPLTDARAILAASKKGGA